MNITEIISAYRNKDLTPNQLVDGIHQKIEEYNEYNVWIYVLSKEELKPYLEVLESSSPDELPLYGIPFAIKDNIDLKGVPTTAGCVDFTMVPKESATVVQLLIDAGAIPIGKTNLDQFATGLVGTRSPDQWGICKNAFNKDFIAGGSSSGSAVAVALEMACFSLGTDTAGSGRVPAAFNQLVGLKPSRGLLSTYGVVPACKSLDCVSIFANTAQDANTVFEVAAVHDSKDPYAVSYHFDNYYQTFGALSKYPRVGILSDSQVETFGDDETLELYKDHCGKLEALGFETHEIDFDPFKEAANLLYSGPWLAERYIAVSAYMESMLEVTRNIISKGIDYSVLDAFNAQYKLRALEKACDKVWEQVDLIVTPTTPGHYTIEELKQDPIGKNTQLGYYTNFMNLLDYAAVASPAGQRGNGLPFGVTFFSRKFNDKNLLSVTNALMNDPISKITTAKSGNVLLVVCGAHLEGYPLNWQLSIRKATLVERTYTAKAYRMYALPDSPPYRPGVIRDPEGDAIEVEVWSIPIEVFGSFVANIPKPLGIGKIELKDGRWENGFICEPYGLNGATEITELRSWRNFIDNTNKLITK